MKTLQKQIFPNGKERLIFSQADFHANLSALQDKEKEQMMNAISGRKCFVPSGKCDRLLLLVKMLLESPVWYSPAVKLQWKVKPLCLKRLTRKRYSNKNMLSKQSVQTLSVKDIQSSRYLYRLAVLEHHTDVIGCGLLPTVTASEGSRGGQFVDGRTITRKTGNVFRSKLVDLAKSGLLPTPMASDATMGAIIGKNDVFITTKNGTPRKVNQNGQNGSLGLARYVQMLPTPQARDFKGQCAKTHYCLPNHFGTSQLNPLFVAEMMGFPTDWTVLPFLNGEKKV